MSDVKEDLLYRMAKAIRNKEGLDAFSFGLSLAKILAELREINPDKYDRLVKGE